MVVYLITNNATHKKYVGKTVKPLVKRWQHHVHKSLTGDTTYLHNAIRKYGPEAFGLSVLAIGADESALNELERFWIAELKTKAPSGYNLTDGGDGQCGYRHTPETRKKLSAALRGKPGRHTQKHSAETRKLIGDLQRGRKQSPEWIAKRAAANTGGVRSAETRARMSKAQKGRNLSEQAKLNMSLAAKRRRSEKEAA